MEIWIWRPGLQNRCLLTKRSNQKMMGSRKLARSWKSGSGCQGFKKWCFLIMGHRQEHQRFQEAGQILEIWIWRPGRKLVRLWKSGSGDQGSNLDALNQGSHKKMICFSRLARSWKSGSGSHGFKIDAFNKAGLARLPRS